MDRILTCPVCSAPMTLGDEFEGEEFDCVACQSPLMMRSGRLSRSGAAASSAPPERPPYQPVGTGETTPAMKRVIAVVLIVFVLLFVGVIIGTYRQFQEIGAFGRNPWQPPVSNGPSREQMERELHEMLERELRQAGEMEMPEFDEEFRRTEAEIQRALDEFPFPLTPPPEVPNPPVRRELGGNAP